MAKSRVYASGAVLAAVLGAFGVAGLSTTLSAGSAVAAADPVMAAVKIDNFSLADQNFQNQELYRLKDAKAVVIITYGNGCPIVRNNAKAYQALKTAYAAKGVEFLMLDSSPQDQREAVKMEAKEYGLDMPIMMDTNQLVGEQLGVTRTAEVIVLDPKSWKVMYRGPVDDRVTYERQKTAATQNYAADALDAVLAGQAVEVAHVAPEGCLINFAERDKRAQFAKISYVKEVAPIIQEKCAECHQAGGIGPMALPSYEQIKGFSPMIREVIRTKRMPPYHADPAVNHFLDDRSLSPAQIKTLVHWIEAGSPRGEGKDPLAAKQYAAAEWPLGKPDLVLDVPAYKVPASGIVDYQRPFVVNPLSSPKWIKSSTVKVENRAGVHHILTGLLAEVPKEGYASESKWGVSVGGYAVGSESQKNPKDVGAYMPVGGAIGFQNHYTPYGKEFNEKSQIALYFYKDGEKPKYVMHNIAIADPSISIGPNEQEHKETAYLEFPKEAILYSAFPHAHYRGRSSDVWIRYPDGKEKMLLAMPKYDFNWQREYSFSEPVKVPAGSKIIVNYTYDNSKRNPANPDSNRTVPWGDQSFDEMLYTALRYRWVDETSDSMKPEYEQALQGGRMIGMFDDDRDGSISKAELKGQMGKGLLGAFAMIDTNKDGKLDANELKVAQAFMNRRERAAPAQTANSTAEKLTAGTPAAGSAGKGGTR